jgi:hypothetical protein
MFPSDPDLCHHVPLLHESVAVCWCQLLKYTPCGQCDAAESDADAHAASVPTLFFSHPEQALSLHRTAALIPEILHVASHELGDAV